MFPDFSYMLHALIGTNPDNWTSIVKTFGLLLVTAILSASFVMYLELKRKEEEGLLEKVSMTIKKGYPMSAWDWISNTAIGFVMGAKFLYIYQNFPEFKMDAASVLLSAKGSFIGGIVGAIIGAGLKYWEKKSEALPEPVTKVINMHPYERIGDITVVAAISGVIGAKIFAVIEDMDALMADPLGQLLSGSGMAIYGGLIGGGIVTYLYVKRMGLTPIHVLDAAAPALIVGSMVGRLGCQLAGDGCWGDPNTAAQPSWWIFPDWLWAYDYPHNVINQGDLIEGCEWLYCRQLTEGVYPTPLYEVLMFAAIFAFLWLIRKRIKIPGMLFAIYLIFNGIERFIIEQIRVNDEYEILGFSLTQAEQIASAFILAGIILAGFLWQRRK